MAMATASLMSSMIVAKRAPAPVRAHGAACACVSCSRVSAARMGSVSTTGKSVARLLSSKKRASVRASAKTVAATVGKTVGKPAVKVTPKSAKGYANVTPEKYPKFFAELDQSFPGAMPYEEYLVATQSLLGNKGFNGENALLLISQCRDEITRPFVDAADQLWGHSFSIASLAGMVMCGKTGFAAGLSHAPQEGLGEDGLEKYVFLVGPHIGISADGEVGSVKRLARGPLSGACGAVMAFQAELTSGKVSTQGDEVDLELNLMKQRMISMISFGGEVPSLVELTKVAHDRSIQDTKATAAFAVNKEISATAYLSGVLIHGPEYTHYFWPGSFEFVTPTTTTDMSEALAGIDATKYAKEMNSYTTARNAMNSVKTLLQSARAGDMSA